MNDQTNPQILIICTGNSARSQMAEGLFRILGAERATVASAGSDPAAAVHPLAIQAMQEIDIDISEHRLKPTSRFLEQSFDYVIAVCSQAARSCPVFPGPAERLDWFYDDPAAVKGNQGEQLAAFRAVRDHLRRRIAFWLTEHFAQVSRQAIGEEDCAPLDVLEAQQQMAVMINVVCVLCCKPDDLTKRVVAALKHLVGQLEGTAAGVYWFQPSGGLEPGDGLQVGEELPASVAAVMQQPSELLEPIQGGAGITWLGVPMKASGTPLGRLWLTAGPEHAFGVEEIELAMMVGHQIALSILSARLYAQVETLASQRLLLIKRMVAIQDERCRRFSRELHDDVNQLLTALSLDLEGLLNTDQVTHAPMRQRLTKMHSNLGYVYDELDRIVKELQPAILEDLGLLPGLRWYANDRLGDQQIEVRVEGGPTPPSRLPDYLEATLYRVGQEAINNISKHADASQVLVGLAIHAHTATLMVRDNGCGFDTEAVLNSPDGQASLGLFGMRERVTLMGGAMALDSTPGEGTSVQFSVPLEIEEKRGIEM